MNTIKVASICMSSNSDINSNIKNAEKYIREAAQNDANWVVLPEMFPFIGEYEKLHTVAQEEDGDLNKWLKSICKELSISIFAGSVPEKICPKEEKNLKNIYHKGYRKVFNTFYAFSNKGETIAKYRKVHLFNLIDSNGKHIYCENDGFVPGDLSASIMHEKWHIGLAICYDLRFPDYFANLAKKKPLDVIVIPSAFARITGIHHWQVLLRARAIEQQCYVIASNQTGMHRENKESYGHSMIIDPWGDIIFNTKEEPGIAYAEISLDTVSSFRSKLPATKSRRFDIY